MRRHQKFSLALIVVITHCPASALPDILAANVPNRNPPFRSFTSFLIVSVIPFINNLDSRSDLTIFIISFNSSFELVNAVAYDP